MPLGYPTIEQVLWFGIMSRIMYTSIVSLILLCDKVLVIQESLDVNRISSGGIKLCHS